MGCDANPNVVTPWFEAARLGDLDYIRKYAKKFSCVTDPRVSDPEYGVYHGFSAIHYAIICEQYEMVRELIRYEYFARLPCDALIHAPCIGPRAQFVLREGMNIQHIAFLVGNQPISDYILHFTHESGESLVGIPDTKGMFSVEVLFFIQTDDVVIKQLHNERMEEELMYNFKAKQFRPTHLHMTGIFARYKLVEHLIQYIESGTASKALIERIYTLALLTTGKQSIIDACKTPLEVKKCGATQLDREKCAYLLQKLANMAISYFEQVQTPEALAMIEEYNRVVNLSGPEKHKEAQLAGLHKGQFTGSLVGITTQTSLDTSKVKKHSHLHKQQNQDDE